MTEPKPIKLELTLEELKLIDKHIEANDDTYSVLMKIINAYPSRKSPVEEAYKEWCGEYPSGPPSENARWDAFLNGYWVTQPKAVPVEEPSKPMNEVLGKLENKYKQAEENAASYMTDEVVDRMLKKWEENPPDFLRFQLGKSLETRIYKWWETCFVHHPEWSMEECVEDLLDIITLFLPAEQSHEGTQNIDTVVAVEAHNELLQKIKSKLRNKK
jgi:hypothetical protein